MSRILVYKYIDVFHTSNYNKMVGTFSKRYNGICPNFGNKVWYQGIISEISTEDNDISFYDPSMSVEIINSTFDLVLYPMANIFSLDYAKGLDGISAFIDKLKIPVFIVSCGAQAKSYDELDTLVDAIGKESKRFIKAVYDSGGDFALRGYFTAEFFEKLGFHQLNVVGCPSLFQLGKELTISNNKVSKEQFKVALNGSTRIVLPLMKRYDSVFYDQDYLFHILYNRTYYDSHPATVINNIRWLKMTGFGAYFSKLILHNRIRLLADVWDWQHSLQHEGFSFAFGTRIHGSILSVLSGIPTVIVDWDSRVREMAELYNIPHIEMQEALQYVDGTKNLYDLYAQVDYNDFHRTFPQKYQAFNDFLVRCGIVKEMNNHNRFWGISSGDYPISAINEAKQRARAIEKHKQVYRMYFKLQSLLSYRKKWKIKKGLRWF